MCVFLDSLAAHFSVGRRGENECEAVELVYKAMRIPWEVFYE